MAPAKSGRPLAVRFAAYKASRSSPTGSPSLVDSGWLWRSRAPERPCDQARPGIEIDPADVGDAERPVRGQTGDGQCDGGQDGEAACAQQAFRVGHDNGRGEDEAGTGRARSDQPGWPIVGLARRRANPSAGWPVSGLARQRAGPSTGWRGRNSRPLVEMTRSSSCGRSAGTKLAEPYSAS